MVNSGSTGLNLHRLTFGEGSGAASETAAAAAVPSTAAAAPTLRRVDAAEVNSMCSSERASPKRHVYYARHVIGWR